jgi:hypothetical protein
LFLGIIIVEKGEEKWGEPIGIRGITSHLELSPPPSPAARISGKETPFKYVCV